MKKLFVLMAFFMAFLTVKSQDLTSLKPMGYINDYQNLFTPEQKDTLEKMMSEYEKKTSIEFALVTYYIEPQNYNPQDVIDLAEKWGVGKSGIDNGFLMFLSYSTEKGMSNYYNVTGYGLEPFLPDGKLNRLESEIFPKTLYVGKIYEAYKQYIKACQNELGDDAYDMLVENKRIKDLEQAEYNKKVRKIFLYVTLLILFLFVFGLLIIEYIKKRKKYLSLKENIYLQVKNINILKDKIGQLPNEYKSIYDNTNLKISKKDITPETYDNLNFLYNKLLEYKSIVNGINTNLKELSNTKNSIKKYLNNIEYFYNFCYEYPKCDSYIDKKLNNILSSFDLDKLEKDKNYNKQRLNKLIGVKTGVERKLKFFHDEMIKIHQIIIDNEEFSKKEEILKNDYSEFIRKRNILLGSKIGNRVINDFDFSNKLSKLKNDLEKSLNLLKEGNLEDALFYYGNYLVNLSVIKNNMSKITSLYNEYNKSLKYVKDKKTKLEQKLREINSKINRSGVSYSRKSKLSNIKSDIKKYETALGVDIILAASLLDSVLSESDTLYSRISSDIRSYSSSSYSSSSYSSSSSGGSFGGFGGGSFGGGGSGGSF